MSKISNSNSNDNVIKGVRKPDNPQEIFYVRYELTPRPSIIIWIEKHCKYFNNRESMMKFKTKATENPLCNVLDYGTASFINGVLTPPVE